MMHQGYPYAQYYERQIYSFHYVDFSLSLCVYEESLGDLASLASWLSGNRSLQDEAQRKTVH